MVYVTGDMHGDFKRFKASKIRRLKKGDTLIVCGDFGFFWNNSRSEKAIIKKLEEKDFDIAFVDGCHENFDIIEASEPVEWHKGKVHALGKNIFHLMRGQIYEIENMKIFAFGGGHSQDFDFRSESPNWWEREQPSHSEILNAIENLKKYQWKIDYIITHEPPASLKDCLNVDVFQRLEVHTFFEDVIRNCWYRKWFFGKCHMDKYIPTKYYALFDSVMQIR